MSDLYIGKKLDGNGKPVGQYRHRISDLVTHAFICGGSGSGKTVIGKALVEECALQGVPAIIVDLKGDLSSLALAFGEISAASLAPWIQVEDGAGLGRAALAEANMQRKRLHEWGLSEADVRRFSEKVAVEIFTPRSESGRRVAIPLISSPPENIQELFENDPDTAAVMLSSMAEALVRRVITAGQRDREIDFVTAIIEHSWRKGLDLTGQEGLGQLVAMILEPPFSSIGVLAVDEHIPEKRREKLAQAVNGQLVGAAANWVRGEEMSVDKLVGANRVDKKTQISVINLSHIPDFEDQSFVVAQFAFAINTWMRQQGSAPGGNRPRLLFFLDEIGGGGGKTAFYPTYPYTSSCKPALNLLVKQGRAFGVGIILATQNPGDIDYKGLSNCGTWIVGKLQTKRDRDKVREGLADAEFSPSDLTKKLARPKTGEFMVLSREGDIDFVKERWLLTYHCTLSPDQLLRYKTKGLAPFEGELDTTIAQTTIDSPSTPEDQAATSELWSDVHDKLGEACRYLEKIGAVDPQDARATKWLGVLRDPDATCQRLADARSARVRRSGESKKQQSSKSGVFDLLTKADTAGRAPRHGAQSTDGKQRESDATADSDVVGEDGSVFYNGRRYQLYRRYAGKSVTFVEEAGELRFTVEGRMLSKSYPV